MKDTTYNGWTNYETWNYKLWMDNDQGSYEYYLELAQDLNNGTHSKEDIAIMLADSLKDTCEQYLEEWMGDQSGPFADILNAGVSQINWYEIANSILEDIEEAA